MAVQRGSDYTRTIDDVVEAHRVALQALNHRIHSNPELCYEEFMAHDACVEFLTKAGCKVTPHAYGLSTSFEAEYSQGTGGRIIVLNAEYDALPGIGHACGHNLIGVGSIAAFLSAVAQLKASNVAGTVRVLGTPAEEGGGGKVALIKKGAYESVDACIMAHPAPLRLNYPIPYVGNIYVPHNAISKFQIKFKGQNAHAAADPWNGRNALDAVVMAYSAIGLLRQQTEDDCRMHGVIVNGGLKQNIIPDLTVLDYAVRAPSLGKLQAVKTRVIDCCEGAAKAAGCTVEFVDTITCADVRPNKAICSVIKEESDKLGYPLLCDFNFPRNPASTDQGNVTYITPGLQFIYGIPADEGCFNHTIGFHTSSGTEEAFDRTLTIAKIMAATVWKILSNDEVALAMKEEFEADKAEREANGEKEGEDAIISRWIIKANGTDSVGKCCCSQNQS
ncbi:metal-dependent amidase/aminoacylase/carboxypeptidase [Coniochaeta ligniaria NRRL 30616]|uniref:Peptidase M20 domain-containing protein 2 n=1 Tax=Coniochaeta ligniaria NRRL 30616 TaxID=1408157 RepID=A0A1J7I9X2_9PEZI|nr:metal-dependent amidase/aminoacylase/carboxypeptidase [Coniochaeta ligniaria NRRL 30616]